MASRIHAHYPPRTACAQDHHHGPEAYEPPFHRLPPPDKPLHEEDELCWNDGVAPEMALDFDAPFMSKAEGVAWWLGGFGFFYLVYLYARWTAHPANKPSGPREIPEEVKATALGGMKY